MSPTVDELESTARNKHTNDIKQMWLLVDNQDYLPNVQKGWTFIRGPPHPPMVTTNTGKGNTVNHLKSVAQYLRNTVTIKCSLERKGDYLLKPPQHIDLLPMPD
ncbi:hypothetical protein BCR41DRAFT_371284 [Lobosporangium transversale]|uniref:Uncharacterized protein n=1 Tax=Lobosporangium transversale TaxID=64571 RepID=A0A1Y2GKN3_9FUNG|nr:hypothetical protein BCR41DRAFT_371284 [Lobosporangium transversale]ORZ13762.1 hypothetical protein BCR41DRAFT_371284 [Lobosporangium transversale]|eukprot:XP_021880546.1 hypothetical protein BCR41DRAFT_371284 [Lobosporangium transversale]